MGLKDAYMLPPANTPAEPKPLKARPAIKAADDGAAADNTEPTTKIRKEISKTAFME